MTKNKYLFLFLIVIVLIMAILAQNYMVNLSLEKADTVEINIINTSIVKNWTNLQSADIKSEKYKDFYVIDNRGAIIYSTFKVKDNTYNSHINEAIKLGNIIADIVINGEIKGKLIIDNHTQNIFSEVVKNSVIVIWTFAFSLIIIIIVFYCFINLKLYKPFKKLSKFAGEVAKGNFDYPLDMDKNNSFGAFQEAFDIMRINIKISKEETERAQSSKREMLAEISHDIKTPIASIRAIAECAQLQTKGEWTGNIISKTYQIERLISEVYHTILDDMGEIKVVLDKIPSSILESLLTIVDYDKKCKIADIPQLYLEMDKLRTHQIFDNIIANSYKYANTQIDINFKVIENFLEIEFRDYGDGIEDKDLSFVMDKFYRGSKVMQSNGEGLGLYVSKMLAQKQGGDLYCKNDNGFVVYVTLKILS